ncbi:hypothetical protein GQ53DRAFT_390247 [Thozetella sp. PMI_491]|nr:hypothetical protein GQ53DRAFT_390247 [Thozetella sp. PMI_491]
MSGWGYLYLQLLFPGAGGYWMRPLPKPCQGATTCPEREVVKCTAVTRTTTATTTKLGMGRRERERRQNSFERTGMEGLSRALFSSRSLSLVRAQRPSPPLPPGCMYMLTFGPHRTLEGALANLLASKVPHPACQPSKPSKPQQAQLGMATISTYLWRRPCMV